MGRLPPQKLHPKPGAEGTSVATKRRGFDRLSAARLDLGRVESCRSQRDGTRTKPGRSGAVKRRGSVGTVWVSYANSTRTTSTNPSRA